MSDQTCIDSVSLQNAINDLLNAITISSYFNQLKIIKHLLWVFYPHIFVVQYFARQDLSLISFNINLEIVYKLFYMLCYISIINMIHKNS